MTKDSRSSEAVPVEAGQHRRDPETGDVIRVVGCYGAGSGGTLWWVSLINDLALISPNGRSENEILASFPDVILEAKDIEQRSAEAQKKPAVIDPYGKRLHHLKTWPFPFNDVVAGLKPFEYRPFDRDFRVGDTLVLEKWDPDTKVYRGASVDREVTYVLPGGTFGVPEGYCVLGLKEIRHPLERVSAEATPVCEECEGTGIIDASDPFPSMKCHACEPPSEDVLRIVHAFDDQERKDAVRELAKRVKATEAEVERLRSVVSAQCAGYDKLLDEHNAQRRERAIPEGQWTRISHDDLRAMRIQSDKLRAVAMAGQMLLMVAGEDTTGLDETEARCVRDLRDALRDAGMLPSSSQGEKP